MPWIRWMFAAAVVVMALAAGSCTQDKPPVKADAALSEGGASPVSANPSADTLAPPEGAQFTIFCRQYRGPDHVAAAMRAKRQLIEHTGSNQWHVMHDEGQSTLYFGYYTTVDRSVPDGHRAQVDRAKIQAMTDTAGDRPFSQCVLVPVDAPDPTAPPEWDLRNAPPEGYWSLEIAAYKDSPLRKQAAVDAVREARKMGIQAFYFHGPTVSSVCIGVWPRDAVKEQSSDSGRARDPQQPIWVLNRPLPEGLPNEVRDKDGHRVRALTPRLEPLDPKMLATIREYPYHSTNGEQDRQWINDPKRGEKVMVRVPAGVVVIPRSGDMATLDGHGAPSDPAPLLINPLGISPPERGRDRLRAFDR